ncbi:glycosyltransferase family 2 protein [Flavihumibacter petaseus]|uniref:glycosyltransferase family 2 protein n=1 Tax=Flavihumibacter petaseus TaxID=549295 RepID=UPI00146FD7B6|nr:glycosyltransferase family 2 protein [Flavihumibacter petaseus]
MSVIMPVYNRAEIVGEAVLSLQHQTFENWELLVVDDISSDNTPEVLGRLAAKDSRIRYFQRQGVLKGASVCRNIGLSESRGDLVIFLDSDDVLPHWCLEERVLLMQEHPETDALISNGAFFREHPSDASKFWNKLTVEGKPDLERFLDGDPVWQTSGATWRKLFLTGKQLAFNEFAKSSQDWEFHVHALLKGGSFKKNDVLPDYFVRRSDKVDTISVNHLSTEKIENRLQLYIEVSQYHESLMGLTANRNKLQRRFLKDIYLSQLVNNRIDSAKIEGFRNLVRPGDRKSQLIYSILKFGNSLQQMKSGIIFKIYRKLAGLFILEKYFENASFYRSPIGSEVSDELVKRLHIQG